ncbi:hypothetical protein C9374_002135 [Naegleria lovaniensis]|uniref:Uncharacterized protein n=1 Tax=Naegleria lovaniensis TaxID=51637 RepID=A0AA88KKT1_NAELO|nr:uncharacterized protein C9374_002135 [Naegleria lovaniensis]KAG2387100.1 hypothetical protein C9374_002135 [Naegleria lovaniensis]
MTLQKKFKQGFARGLWIEAMDLNEFIISAKKYFEESIEIVQDDDEGNDHLESTSEPLVASSDLQYLEHDDELRWIPLRQMEQAMAVKKLKMGHCTALNEELFVSPQSPLSDIHDRLYAKMIENTPNTKPMGVVKAIKFLERVLTTTDTISLDRISIYMVNQNLEMVIRHVTDRDLLQIELFDRGIEIIKLVLEKFAQGLSLNCQQFWTDLLTRYLSFFVTERPEDSMERQWELSSVMFERMTKMISALREQILFMKCLIEVLFSILLNERTCSQKNPLNGKPFYLLKLFEMLGSFVFEQDHTEITSRFTNQTDKLIAALEIGNSKKDDMEYLYMTRIIGNVARLKTLKELKII